MKPALVKEIFILAIVAAFLTLFLYGLGQAIVPLTFSLFLAYASLPLVKKLEAHKLSRLQATAAVLTGVTFVGLILILIIVPPLFGDLREAVLEVPKNLSVALGKLEVILSDYDLHVPYDRESLIEFSKTYMDNISSGILHSAGEIVSRSLINAASIIVIVLNLFMIPVFFAYVVNDSDALIKKIEILVPPSKRPSLNSFLAECDTVLSGYIRGQLLVCLILSTLYTTGLLFVGIKFAVIIGIMTGFLSIIPYVGFSFGFTAALITALANSEGSGALIGIAVVYGVVQFLESFLITPRIVGDKVGLTPFEAILALIILGNLFGFAGLFLAIPTGAIGKILLRRLLAEYKKTAFYKS